MIQPTPRSTAVLRAQDLGLRHAGVDVLAGLSFSIACGLTWVRGGDGRGKTTLLRLLAGTLAPTGGVLQRDAASVWFEDAADGAENATVAQAWLDARRARLAGWDRALERRLVDAFGLAPHIAKPLYMLSTGSRRKVGLAGAVASGARLTLIDAPFAALDAPSVRVLMALFEQAATDAQRAWVVADHERPAALAGAPLAAWIDLGD
jgi:ABC-type transport system involved in cytochrome c biogenesis ATPase subunit